MSCIIFAGILQGCFLILLLKTKKTNSISDSYLIVWLGLCIIQLSFFFDNLLSNPLLPVLFQISGFFIPLLSSFLFYLYVHSLAFDYQFRFKRNYLHLIPYTLFWVISFSLFIERPSNISFQDGYPIFGNNISSFLSNFLTVPLAIIPAFYTILSMGVLVKYQKLLPENYSFTEKINLNWLKWVVFSFPVLFVVLFLLIKFGTSLGLLSFHNLFAVVGSFQSLYVFFIGFFGLKQSTALIDNSLRHDFSEIDLPKTNYRNSGLSEEMVNHRFEKLLKFMIENEPFLDAELSLHSLAQLLRWTPNQLSQVINQKTSSNFFTFINGYRVETVKKKLKEPTFSKYTIIAIANDSGFQSKSSFNKIFKEMVGQTPIEFQKS